MGLCKGLQAGTTARLTKGLQGAYGVAASSPPTYPTTDLIQAEIYPDGLTLSGANVTGWTAAVGVNLTPTGTVTQVANGVNFAASSGLNHSAVTIPASTPFTMVLAGYRATSTSNLILGAVSGGATVPFVGINSNSLYLLDNTGSPGNPGVTINTTGKQYLYFRRDSIGLLYVGGTGLADTNVGAFGDYSALVFTFTSITRPPYDSYDATSGNMSRFIYAGTGGDLVASGQMANLVAYLVAKNGVAT